MKRRLILSVLLAGAMCINAQITKVATLTQEANWSGCSDVGNVVYTIDETRHNISIYDRTFQNPKSITIQTKYQNDGIWIPVVARNIFTTDGKACVLVTQYDKDSQLEWRYRPATVKIIDEDGNIVKDFGDCVGNLEDTEVINIDGLYFLLIPTFGDVNITDVYSLPGNGQPTNLDTPTIPTRTTNARKIVEDGKMYIILDGVKYAVTGSTTL